MRWLLKWLQNTSVDTINIDGEDRLLMHEKILADKQMLRQVFTEFHHAFRRLDEIFFNVDGDRIELGAGIAPIKESYRDVLATDVVYGKHLDRVLDAENLELFDQTVRVLYLQNCFHHFPNPERFFMEINRVLKPGGGVILLEPYYGPIASFLFKRLFKTEGFDKHFPYWETPVIGPMNGANQALSYIVFVRDRVKFEKKYPDLKIMHQELCCNYLKYLFSGGLNFKQLLPNWMSPMIVFFQKILSPLDAWIALHHMIVIRKEPISM